MQTRLSVYFDFSPFVKEILFVDFLDAAGIHK